jgi:hypothetical protein
MEFYTQNGWAGEEYEKTKNLSTSEIAQLIRKEIRERFPKVKASVRTSYFSGGSSIDVRLRVLPFNPITVDFDPKDNSYPSKQRYTEECLALLRDIKAIGDKYRYNDSDGMIDYFSTNFYFDVALDWELERDAMKERGILC